MHPQLKNFYIETFGCQMNKSDSELIKHSMLSEGFIESENAQNAQIRIYNTCSVRQHAEDRVLARIETAKPQITAQKGITVVAGCMAQRMGSELIKSNHANIVLGPYQSPTAGKIIKSFLNDNNKSNKDNKTTFISQNPADFSDRLVEPLIQDFTHSWKEFVTITHGCENYCSYCIVPYVRGKLISFDSNDILKHIEKLTQRGITEITLLGQNVNQYGQDSNDITFAKLLEKTAKIENLKRIHFITSHPKDFSDDILQVIADNKNISRSIHLPLQSGSDKILNLMNRQYTLKQYTNIFEKIKTISNDFSVTTDLIAGCPNETEEDFNETLDAVKSLKFDEAFMYAYSPREGTQAFELQETITRKEKIKRLNTLIETQRAISLQILQGRVNKVEEFIPEKISKKNKKELMGKTSFNHPAVIEGSKEDLGKILKIKITSVKGSTLYAEKIS